MHSELRERFGILKQFFNSSLTVNLWLLMLRRKGGSCSFSIQDLSLRAKQAFAVILKLQTVWKSMFFWKIQSTFENWINSPCKNYLTYTVPHKLYTKGIFMYSNPWTHRPRIIRFRKVTHSTHGLLNRSVVIQWQKYPEHSYHTFIFRFK